jgi:hypothetical protein
MVCLGPSYVNVVTNDVFFFIPLQQIHYRSFHFKPD